MTETGAVFIIPQMSPSPQVYHGTIRKPVASPARTEPRIREALSGSAVHLHRCGDRLDGFHDIAEDIANGGTQES